MIILPSLCHPRPQSLSWRRGEGVISSLPPSAVKPCPHWALSGLTACILTQFAPCHSCSPCLLRVCVLTCLPAVTCLPHPHLPPHMHISHEASENSLSNMICLCWKSVPGSPKPIGWPQPPPLAIYDLNSSNSSLNFWLPALLFGLQWHWTHCNSPGSMQFLAALFWLRQWPFGMAFRHPLIAWLLLGSAWKVPRSCLGLSSCPLHISSSRSPPSIAVTSLFCSPIKPWTSSGPCLVLFPVTNGYSVHVSCKNCNYFLYLESCLFVFPDVRSWVFKWEPIYLLTSKMWVISPHLGVYCEN